MATRNESICLMYSGVRYRGFHFLLFIVTHTPPVLSVKIVLLIVVVKIVYCVSVTSIWFPAATGHLNTNIKHTYIT